ncbi:MAG: TrmB family transcriptional regulator [Promethearchaeota archaeon]|jgi:sugar-specific transcriptional regulator TrmB
MSSDLILEIEQFLKNGDLSTYEVKVFTELLLSSNLNARELSERSGVPTGRIYEILAQLREKGMIEIQESRPKIYRALAFNSAFQNLISYIDNKRKDKASFLYNQAKILENKIFNSDLFIKKETSKIFWSTTFGAVPILSLYEQKMNALHEELLMTGFLNENTLKVLPYGKVIYNGIKNALSRGVQVKYLWSFDFDNRPLPNNLISEKNELYDKLKKKMDLLFNLSVKIEGFEMKYMYKRIPSYYDIFDDKQVLLKLQNPLNLSQIYASINIIDINLADDLKRRFHQLWVFEALD